MGTIQLHYGCITEELQVHYGYVSNYYGYIKHPILVHYSCLMGTLQVYYGYLTGELHVLHKYVMGELQVHYGCYRYILNALEVGKESPLKDNPPIYFGPARRSTVCVLIDD